MSPFQTISRRCPTSQSSSWCRCSSSWSSSTSSSSAASTHLRSCTNAAVTHPEDAVKLFHPLSWLSCWLFFFCFKTVSIHELSQDESPRSTKVVSMANVGKSAEDRVILNCWIVSPPPLTNLKRRPNCYTSLLLSRCYSFYSKLNVALLVFFVWMAWCLRATAQWWGLVELSSMRLILTPLYLSHIALQTVCCAQFSNFKEALNLTDLTWSLFLTTNQRTPFLKFRFLSTYYYL